MGESILDVLICTVGTSLMFPNLENLRTGLETGSVDADHRPAAEAYAEGEWMRLGRELRSLDPADKVCGAEINSLHSMCGRGLINGRTELYLLHSDTDDGLHVAEALKAWYRGKAQALRIEGLQDADPREFRKKGLRELAKRMCEIIHTHRRRKCGINATGGYKAQIAIAALIGQALGVPVYYKHERFDEVIEFPPMPVSLDFEYWAKISDLLLDLAGTTDAVPESDYREEIDGDERIESLIERTEIDGADYIELSPVGQVFHEAFRGRFESVLDQVLPKPVADNQKSPPSWEVGGHMRSHPEVMVLMEKITGQNPFVLRCATWYYNPDLPQRSRFRRSAHGIEGIISNGTWTAKIRVDTSATTEGQMDAAVAALNL